MRIESPAFHSYGHMPARYTCEGADVSPPLSFHLDGARARSLALIVEDPDGPTAPWVHWIVYNLPASTTFLPEGVDLRSLPARARLGANSWGGFGWAGPCPPAGRHRYVFTLFALDTMLRDLGVPTRDELLRAMAGHTTAEAFLVGTYALDRPSRHAATRA